MGSDTVDGTRARILRATMELLAREGRRGVSTRAVSAAAGIQPQTIYRQFGDMDGLLAEAAHEGFRRYLSSKSSRPRRTDPVDDLRDGWDLHIEFGVQHPALYLLMYGAPDQSRESFVVSESTAILRGLVETLARAGRLRIDIETAVAMIHSTGVGVVISLIGSPEGDPGASDLSKSVREAILDAIVAPSSAREDATAAQDNPAIPASALRAVLIRASSPLTPGESLLLDELLTKISTSRRA
ncbi:TetR/AcrR family transcriptional regulator [Microbacterium betulae]|uniref:TetR/AcrR family transcriptional regulator n=1 Tax=Microbacterium betulae TaxID=2981139 RepID=A0AA97I764_9MICO|nr:TetR/AcrR family transcriptional regulator [Microbacterium sp. AB]WOF23922.1 TetR/AcrR family transcriptional regulator [Microbacterium sp. AB]